MSSYNFFSKISATIKTLLLSVFYTGNDFECKWIEKVTEKFQIHFLYVLNFLVCNLFHCVTRTNVYEIGKNVRYVLGRIAVKF